MSQPSAVNKRLSLRETFNAFSKISWKDIKKIGKETLKDLRKPGEIFALAAGVIVPGGFIAYAAYRVIKHKQSPLFGAV